MQIFTNGKSWRFYSFTEFYVIHQQNQGVKIWSQYHFKFEESSDGESRYIIVARSSFSESSVFKIFSSHSKTEIRRFQLNFSGLNSVFKKLTVFIAAFSDFFGAASLDRLSRQSKIKWSKIICLFFGVKSILEVILQSCCLVVCFSWTCAADRHHILITDGGTRIVNCQFYFLVGEI